MVAHRSGTLGSELTPPRPDYNQPFYPRLSMSLISIITQTLKSQYPLPAERSNLRELPPPPTAASHEENAWFGG